MHKLIGIVVLQVASCASILGLYFSLYPLGSNRPSWHWALVVTPAVITLFLAVREITDYYKSRPKIFRSKNEINNYMQNWITSAGRVVIFSRDMSWAQEQSTVDILLSKARQNELTVCIEHDIPLTNDLRRAGAKIIKYGALNHVPKSRFTIVDYEREGARVAVGASIMGHHVIEEFQSGQHPFFAVAEDLVKILSAYNELP